MGTTEEQKTTENWSKLDKSVIFLCVFGMGSTLAHNQTRRTIVVECEWASHVKRTNAHTNDTEHLLSLRMYTVNWFSYADSVFSATVYSIYIYIYNGGSNRLLHSLTIDNRHHHCIVWSAHEMGYFSFELSKPSVRFFPDSCYQFTNEFTLCHIYYQHMQTDTDTHSLLISSWLHQTQIHYASE